MPQHTHCTLRLPIPETTYHISTTNNRNMQKQSVYLFVNNFKNFGSFFCFVHCFVTNRNTSQSVLLSGSKALIPYTGLFIEVSYAHLHGFFSIYTKQQLITNYYKNKAPKVHTFSSTIHQLAIIKLF